MADLKVEKKKSSPVLWTILGIVVVGLIVWLIWDASDGGINDQEEMAEAEQLGEEGFYAEPRDWEGADNEPWDDETTMNEDWRAENREFWGDESDAMTDENMPAEELKEGEITPDEMTSDERRRADTETFGERENVADESTPANEDENTFGMDYSGALGTDVTAPDTTGQTENFRNFIAFAEKTDAEDLNRKLTYRGIKKLTMAVSNLEVTDSSMVEWKSDIDRLKYQTEQLRDESMSGQQATVIKSTFMDIARTFENIQKKADTEIEEEVSQVMQAAQEINEQEKASNQREQIDNFFDEAADVLEKLKENTPEATTSSIN